MATASLDHDRMPVSQLGSSPIQADALPIHLISGLFAELLNSALLSGVTASVANSVATGAHPNLVGVLVSYLPPLPTIYPSLAADLLRQPQTGLLALHMQEYYAHLGLMRDLTHDVADANGRFSSVVTDCIDQIARNWQKLAGSAAAAIDQWKALPGLIFTISQQERAGLVQSILADVALGMAPCVDDQGAVTVPAWAERRQIRRLHRNLHLHVMAGDRIERVLITNASDNGIGIIGLRGVQVGDGIEILIGPGRTLPATIVWVRGDQVGIAYDSPPPMDWSLAGSLN